MDRNIIIRHIAGYLTGFLFRKGAKPSRPCLKVGKMESARRVRELELEEHPFQFRIAKGMTSCIDLPEPGYEFRV